MSAVTRKRRSHKSHRERDDVEQRGVRLQKVLAAAGVGSRRECETLIQSGRVEVDGATVTQLGTRVDPLRQRIRVDGVTLPRPRRVYFVLNKPEGVVCTNRDPAGRVRVIDLIRSDERLFTVGRLDRSSEGLILVTNDGELSNRLAHPRYGIQKKYRVVVAGHPNAELLNQLRRGIRMSDGVAKVVSANIKRQNKDSAELEVILDEGRNREIRRLLARIGHKVLRLRRIGLGPLSLADLPVGAYRRLTTEEVRSLRDATRSRPPRKSSHPSEAEHSVRQQDQTRDEFSTVRQGRVLGGDERRRGRQTGKAGRSKPTRKKRR